MLHAVPFTVHLEHGYFNYQPNFFESLAKYNAYDVFGIWVGPDWQLASFIPWQPTLLDYLVLNAKTTHLLVALLQKQYDKPFCVPFQGVYEPMTSDQHLARYAMVVDGEIFDAARARHHVTAARSARLAELPGRDLLAELNRRIRRRLTAPWRTHSSH
jgi:hypothetical protein